MLVMFLILKNDCGYRGFHCISFITLTLKYFITEKKNSDSRGQKIVRIKIDYIQGYL